MQTDEKNRRKPSYLVDFYLYRCIHRSVSYTHLDVYKRQANWSPRNSDGPYRGMKPAPFGLILSRNTMSARIGNRAGLSNVIQSAQLAGFHGNIARTPALYLGTWEASPLDIASAYSVFANGGRCV